MDHYAGNVSTGTSYSSLPSITPQQLQHHASVPAHTLPPLQPQHTALSMHSLYGQPLSAPHTPTTTTPNTPGSTSNGSFQQMGAQSASRGYHLQSAPYQQPLQSFGNSSALMPQTSGSMSHPLPIAPAPGPSQTRLVPLRPLNSSVPLHAQHGMHPQIQPGMQSPYGQQTSVQEPDTPTHVVGSQGRRGILPSAPGRPTVNATGTGATKSTLIPAKDADGKFPCPHCTKTYLHAKHLKRHLLRHTGDRPYMCVLCRDTFSRSDILKRHFQKCSIRRGNPTGASHLSHAQAHLKKSHPGPHKGSASSSTDGDMMRNMNGLNGLPTDPNLVPFGVIADIPDRRIIDPSSNLTEQQATQGQLSRSNSLKRMSIGGGRDRRSLTGQGLGGSSRASFDQNFSGDIPSSMAAGVNPQLAAYNMPNGHNGPNYGQNYDFTNQGNGGSLHTQGNHQMSTIPNGRAAMPMYGGSAPGGQQSNVDWSQMFQPGAQDGFISPLNNTSLGNNQMAIKAENSLPTSDERPFIGMYANAGDGITASNFPAWNFSMSLKSPLQQLSHRLIEFCFPATSQVVYASDIRNYLSVDNIRHFLKLYTNFQGHFSIIHMSSFRITDAYEGLILAMICIGAVYSERLSPPQVRELMEQAQSVVEKDSRVFAVLSQDRGLNSDYASGMLGSDKVDLEEIQAILLLQVLFTWHGTPVQREMARRKYPMLVKFTRMSQIDQPSTIPRYFSLLHQPNVSVEHFNAANFDWAAWVEQEKRSRLFYVVFLVDTAMTLYFNNAPQFDCFSIPLPLPADDAAWDARTATECAEALGLHGPVAAKKVNPEGSRRARQPDMHTALTSLVESGLNLKTGTTNVYSKFILVHALHVQIWRTQKYTAQNSDSGKIQLDAQGYPLPLSTINNALDKWKMAWDEDMSMQYPPSSTNFRRFGFCRDGVHFFYLAKYLMKNRLDPQMAPDQRFSYVMHLLKSVKTWVISDSASRGEELGSVNDIDQSYGMTDLTLDMAQLFKPINKLIDSPVSGINTNITGGML